MTAEPDLLPLPEGGLAGEMRWGAQVYGRDEMHAYARANVAHATAAKDADIEALRAEVELLRRGIVPRDDDMIVPVKLLDEINASGAEWKARAERLAEALRWYAEQSAGCRKLGRDGDAARAALDADGGGRARAALEQEAGRG